MAIYRIQTNHAPGGLKIITRRRRDAAAFQFKAAIYRAAERQALRDRPSAWKAYIEAERFQDEELSEAVVNVGDTEIHCWRA